MIDKSMTISMSCRVNDRGYELIVPMHVPFQDVYEAINRFVEDLKQTEAKLIEQQEKNKGASDGNI